MKVVGAIVARNGGGDLQGAWADLAAICGDDGVVVIDNASTDGSTAALSGAVIRHDENTGFAGGAQDAVEWAAARGADAVLLLNQDARLDTAGGARMIDLLAAKREAGIVFAKVLQADKPYLLDGLGGRRNLRHKLTTSLGAGGIDPVHLDQPRMVDHGHGAAMLLRVAAVRWVGGFDRNLFAYHEEVDLCWRLARAGFSVWVEPQAVVLHRGARGDAERDTIKQYFIGRNSVLAARRQGVAGRVLIWALAAALVYYAPIALTGDRAARALLAGWWDGWRGRSVRPTIRKAL
ncbi:MAG: glycosyltransferase family 2 protein [Candidatus Lernaella stagnicola]|nr:glycosyltransferase family 2 protein [Candidatus Lernaella stagnicola]